MSINRNSLRKIIREELSKIDEGFSSGTFKDSKDTQTRSEKVGYKMVGEEDKPSFDLSKESDRGDGEFPSGNLKTIKEWTEKDETDGTIKRWSKPLGDKYTEYEKKKFGLKEAGGEFDKIQIPATVKRWMNRFIDSVNSVKLERIKKMAILYKVIKSLGLNPQELNTYIQRIRRGLK